MNVDLSLIKANKSSLLYLDEKIIAPLNGFKDREDYY
jgi:predicted alpha/beta-fold hydrolase